MTRKDYVLLAEALLEASRAVDDHYAGQSALWESAYSEHFGIKRVATELARRLSNENPRFDVHRFLKAAGVK